MIDSMPTFGRTICKVYDTNSWHGINHFSNYYFRFIDIFEGQSREIPITHDTDVGFANGNVYIIETNFGTTNFKRISNDEFVSDVPTLCNRKYCVFATIGKNLYAIGGKHKS